MNARHLLFFYNAFPIHVSLRGSSKARNSQGVNFLGREGIQGNEVMDGLSTFIQACQRQASPNPLFPSSGNT
jgi:hypothetical protein